MNKLTYTSELINFNPKDKIIEANVFLPAESNGIKHIINPLFNLTQKDTNNNNINIVLCHLSCGINAVLCGNHTFPIVIETDKLVDLGETYDFNISQCLLIIFHDEISTLTSNDIQFIIKNINTFNLTAEISNFTIQENNGNNALLRPRAIGLSVIR